MSKIFWEYVVLSKITEDTWHQFYPYRVFSEVPLCYVLLNIKVLMESTFLYEFIFVSIFVFLGSCHSCTTFSQEGCKWRSAWPIETLYISICQFIFECLDSHFISTYTHSLYILIYSLTSASVSEDDSLVSTGITIAARLVCRFPNRNVLSNSQ